MKFIQKYWIQILILVILIYIANNYYKKNELKKANEANLSNNGYVPYNSGSGSSNNNTSTNTNTNTGTGTSNTSNTSNNSNTSNTSNTSNVSASGFSLDDELYMKSFACIRKTPSSSGESLSCYAKDVYIGDYLGEASNGYVRIFTDEYFSGGGPFGVFGSVQAYVLISDIYKK